MIEVLHNRAIVHIVGPDSCKFLQGMTTNDIIKKAYSYNYLLTNQGKYLFDFFVYKQNPESCVVDIDKASLNSFLKRMMMYKLRSNLEIEDISDTYRILYSNALIDTDVEYSLQDTRYSKLGYRFLVKAININKIEVTTDNLYLVDKYKHSIIDGCLDLEYDRSIPVEYGAEELNAIDYNKGCYVGQEVISRVKYQGVIRKKIFKLQFEEEIGLKEKKAEITDLEGNKLGYICSVYKNQAIALLRAEKFLNLKKKSAIVEGQIATIEIPTWRK